MTELLTMHLSGGAGQSVGSFLPESVMPKEQNGLVPMARSSACGFGLSKVSAHGGLWAKKVSLNATGRM